MPAITNSLHTPNKRQPAPVGPPLLEATTYYRGTRVFPQDWRTPKVGYFNDRTH